MIAIPPEIDITELTGANGVEALVDMRFFPITIEKKIGDSSEEYVHNFYKWRKACSAYANSIGTVHVSIMNINEWGVPKPTTRKLIGEYSSHDKHEEGFAWQYIIVDRPVVRGAVTAIIWMRGDQSVYSFVADWAEAIRMAKMEYEKRDLEPPPLDGPRYDIPAVVDERRRQRW